MLDRSVSDPDNAIVPKFRIDSLAALARQMEFTPQDTRAAQVAGAEELLHTIDPNKAYPLEFVIFRITGYRPKSISADLLTGLALQHDLGLLVEHVSNTLDVRTDALAEPVLAIEDACERFNVTSKTIQRWRRKGLPARRFIFPDGKRRVGFLLSSVERFFAAHRDQVATGMNVSLVDQWEQAQIVRRARRLAIEGGCSVEEITRRIGKRLNRSPAMVLHILRKHDQDHPSAQVLPAAALPIEEDERARILRRYRKGSSLRAIARRFGRARHAIYRVILEERIRTLTRRKAKFIDDPLYHEADAELAIRAITSQEADLSATAGGASSRPEEARVPRDLPTYLADLYRAPLLTPARERALFLKLNYHKFQFVTARRGLEPQFARSRDLDRLEHHLHQATETKNEILRANMRLVASVARKHLRPGVSLMELVSEGSMVMMRAVESFDVHRGHRFSTYATLALMKGFARSVPQIMSTRRSKSLDLSMLDAIPDYRRRTDHDAVADREQVRQLLASLDDRERQVLLAHYGLGAQGVPATSLEQLGDRLGLSKQRVRQIERGALEKLRGRAGLP